ncbi:unnamed protein product [Lactuca saligna]|uniref:PTC1-like winged helix-turn-helix domain-containing protein n=1 Tax=Lactuca saligna TaxID=75948 RepID=A0AA35ZP75_LACSI|nr:unnamed protein product [Lactuca saligna]
MRWSCVFSGRYPIFSGRECGGDVAPTTIVVSADENQEEEVQPGSIYEIYHKNLPPRTHLQLRSVHVIMNFWLVNPNTLVGSGHVAIKIKEIELEKELKNNAMGSLETPQSKERYLAAELSLLEAMKEKNAMIGNPITRPALRVEVQKRKDHTGSLDHLLKIVANKVAPGGNLRLRRSHNTDGAMEYWLESADLLKIRKDIGDRDSFWTPPWLESR